MEKREKPQKQATLCIIVDKKENRILLAMKNRGFGVGKYNGFGGKLMEGETLGQAMVRELKEESGLNYEVDDLKKVGEFDFYFPHKPEFDQTVHVYLIEKLKESPQNSEEMTYKWFGLNEVPYSQMWDGDKHWLPLVLDNKKLRATFVFKKENNENVVNEKELIEVDNFYKR